MKTVIGIDLGTTNIVVSYAHFNPATKAYAPVELFPIPQLVAPGQMESLPMLPAARYHHQAEFDRAQLALPWGVDKYNQSLPEAIIGKLAHELGNKTPSKCITSAKSWLGYLAESNDQIQLPKGAPEGVATCTPLEATASYLAYIQAAWDYCFPKHPMAKQQLVVTVPASFDDIARALTIEALQRTGLSNFKLLEEPQAACYFWLKQHDAKTLAQRSTLMVCDVGGGTTDFTLVKITPSKVGEAPTFERIAVGEHLMLGGDNMDLALAARALEKLELEPTLANINKLVGQCQKAKEAFLSDTPPEETRLQWQTGGSGLFAGIKETRLTLKESEQLLLEGFFPTVAADSKPKTRKRSLADTGLPYPSDAAISRHIAWFLQQHNSSDPQQDAAGQPGKFIPDVWLLNGGPFLSQQVSQRLQNLVASWQDQQNDNPVLWLSNQEPQYAVAKGATLYGIAHAMQQQLIASSVVRNYFLQVDSEHGAKAVCILPKATQVNAAIKLPGQRFTLTLGQSVRFQVAYSLEEQKTAAGQITPWHESLHLMPPLTTQIAGEGEVEVELEALLDELGVLNVKLLAISADQQWQLAFNLRKETLQDNDGLQHHPKLPQALDIIEHWYGNQAKRQPKEPLKKSLEKLLGTRNSWSSLTARSLFDHLLKHAKRRRRSPQHERGWFNIAGYCLRPGMGFVGDRERIEQVWGLYGQGLQHNQQKDIWAQWWAFWRRAAAGLNQQQQLVIYSDINHVLNANQRKQGGKPKVATALEEKLRLLGSLERLPLDIKTNVVHSCANQLNDAKLKQDFVFCTARLLNRQLMYADASFRLDQAFVDEFLGEFRHLPDDIRKQLSLIEIAALGKNKDKMNQQMWGDELPTGLSL